MSKPILFSGRCLPQCMHGTKSICLPQYLESDELKTVPVEPGFFRLL